MGEARRKELLMAIKRNPGRKDILLWPNGDWCLGGEWLDGEYYWRMLDYRILVHGSPDWLKFVWTLDN